MTLPPLPQRHLLPVEAAEALDTLYGAVRKEQDSNNVKTTQAVADAAAKMEQTRSEALKLGPVDKRFISLTTANPRTPTTEEWQAAGGHDSRIIGAKLTPLGAVQLIWYNGAAGWWELYGSPTYTSAQAARTGVDAALYGVREDAPVQTLMDAIAATPDGGDLICPRVTLKHAVRTNMWILNRRNLTIRGNGLRVVADANMPDEIGTYDTAHPDWGNPYTGGFKIAYSENVFIHEIEYDGRLDVRKPAPSDDSGSGPRSAWNILDRSVNVQLIDCKGMRGMMDGVCVGPVEKMFLLKQGISDYGDVVPERDFPRNCLLKNFVAEYNYRQGMSGVGHFDLTIDAGRYAFTGRLPDGPDGHKKWTLPCAGICLEAFFVFGWLNVRTKIINRPEITENRGIGLLIENGTRHSQIDVWSHHNWGEGVVENGGSGTMDNYVDGIFEYNCNNPASDAWRNAEVARSGVRPTQRGVIRANRRNGGLTITQPCLDPDVQGVNITATDPRPGERCGNVLIATGGETAIDTTTGTYYGYVPGTTTDEQIKKPVPQSGGIIMGNTVVNGTWEDDYLAAFEVNAPGARVIGNEARKTVSADLGSKRGVYIGAAAYASGNSGIGYPIPLRSNAPGEHLERLPAPYFAINKMDNVALSSYTAADYAKKVTLLSDDPDVLRYEVEWTVAYDAVDAGRIAQFDVLPTNTGGRKWQAVSVQARNGDAGGPVAAWRQNDAALISITVPRNVLSVITVTAVVEVRRG